MHIAHLVLVKAEDREDAVATVEMILNDFDGGRPATFYDWFSVGEGYGSFGGSRWTISDWNIETQNPYVVSYQEEKEQFMQLLNNFVEAREKEFERAKEEALEISIHNLETFKGDYQKAFNAYKLSLVAELASGDYIADSRYYDLSNYSTTLTWFEEDLEKGEDNWYGVIVDFHF